MSEIRYLTPAPSSQPSTSALFVRPPPPPPHRNGQDGRGGKGGTLLMAMRIERDVAKEGGDHFTLVPLSGILMKFPCSTADGF